MQIQNANPPIQVTGRHVSVTEAMKEYCRRKMAGVHLDYPKIIEVQVILGVQKYRHSAEIILHCSNHITIEAESECDDMYASIDEVVDKVGRQMRKYKTRLMRNHRPRRQPVRLLEEKVLRWEWVEESVARPDHINGSADTTMAEPVAEPQVIQTETYLVRPMFVDEALLQLEMSDLQFLLFHNAKTEKMNVMYRRKNGEVGLMEPTAP